MAEVIYVYYKSYENNAKTQKYYQENINFPFLMSFLFFWKCCYNELERIPNVTRYFILFTNFLIGYNPEKYGYYHQIQSVWLQLTYCVALNLYP